MAYKTRKKQTMGRGTASAYASIARSAMAGKYDEEKAKDLLRSARSEDRIVKRVVQQLTRRRKMSYSGKSYGSTRRYSSYKNRRSY